MLRAAHSAPSTFIAELERSAKIMKIIAFFIVAGALLALCFVPAPTEGFYSCWLFSNLNDSRGYLVLRDGNIDLVNEKNGKTEKVRNVGIYEKLSDRQMRITIEKSFGGNSDVVSVGWFGFDFSPAFGKGAPSSFCRASREIRPWIIQNLK